MFDLTPYTFSAPKFIYYNIDTNLFRNSLIIFIIFIILLVFFVIIISVNSYNNKRFTKMVRIIRYRLLNDLFSICLTPLLLFSCQIIHQKTVNIFVTSLLAIISVGYVMWISYKIVQVRKLTDL
jgi:hypothetical protein